MAKDLIEYLGVHLDYEVKMLNGTYFAIPRAPLANDETSIVKDALIESFCIHARALFEFFREEASRHEYTSSTYARCGHEEKYRQRLNTQIAHVIYEGRTADDAKKINSLELFEMLNDLRQEWTRFKAARKAPYDTINLRDVAVYLTASKFNTTSSHPVAVTFTTLSSQATASG